MRRTTSRIARRDGAAVDHFRGLWRVALCAAVLGGGVTASAAASANAREFEEWSDGSERFERVALPQAYGSSSEQAKRLVGEAARDGDENAKSRGRTTPGVETTGCVELTADGRWRKFRGANRWIPGVYSTDDFPANTTVLTYDDGPHGNTPYILSRLKRYELKATFFVVGRAIKSSNYHLIRQMIEDGHSLGNHTYSHPVRIASEAGEDSLEYIRVQYELAQAMVDIALLATSSEDFRRLSGRLRRGLPYAAPVEDLVQMAGDFRRRHAEILSEYGYEPGQHPYRMVYSRPPGGSPYMGKFSEEQREAFSAVVRSLGLLNIMWHRNTRDSDPTLPKAERLDTARIVRTLTRTAREGGVWVAHDRGPRDAARASIRAAARSESIRVVTLDEVIAAKYGCDAAELVRSASWSNPVLSSESSMRRLRSIELHDVISATVSGTSRDDVKP